MENRAVPCAIMPYRSYWYYAMESGRQGLSFINLAFKYCQAFRINIDVLELTKAAFQDSLERRSMIGCSERLFCCIKTVFPLRSQVFQCIPGAKLSVSSLLYRCGFLSRCRPDADKLS